MLLAAGAELGRRHPDGRLAASADVLLADARIALVVSAAIPQARSFLVMRLAVQAQRGACQGGAPPPPGCQGGA